MHRIPLLVFRLLIYVLIVQFLGVGFAVLDPIELEAAKAAVSRNYLIAQSAGMFVNNNNTGKSPTANSTVPDLATKAAMSAHSNAASAAAVPKSFASAVGRTSIALTNQFKHRLVTMKSFVEVQGDEYNLAPVVDSVSVKVPPALANEDTNKLHSKAIDPGTVSAKLSTSPKNTPTTPKRNATMANNSMGAAAAAALQNVLQDETTMPLQIGDASPTVTTAKNNTDIKDTKNTKDTLRGDVNPNDFYKLQNVRVSKIDADVAAATVQRLARSISAKSKGLLVPTAPATVDMNVPPSLAQDSNNPDANEYEIKYRNLLIDAQKLEVARAKAEKKQKDDAKAHHKQLLRMSAHVTTLQNKLQASHHSANLMLQKIPHVVFSPMIAREYNNNFSTEYGVSDYETGHKAYDYIASYQHPSVKSNTTRSAEHTKADQNHTEYTHLTTLHSMFDSAVSDINVLLNNSRAPRRRDFQDSSTGVDEEATDFVNRGGSTSPPRSRGPSAPTQQVLFSLVYV